MKGKTGWSGHNLTKVSPGAPGFSRMKMVTGNPHVRAGDWIRGGNRVGKGKEGKGREGTGYPDETKGRMVV